ncbi:TPA: hypothetical protein ACG0A7_002556 [Enterobacter roggenkampii]|uniref:hypothetical protein n=1 Tax=Enterobacter cloacae complex TaxID=354276 RepID=UPI00101DB152|nr:hypothetical protein [Enterobacter hormaechei]MCM8117117.1 hypothetical protein [Enterobacter hormaechei]MDL4434906.1 hypothetical protein [Enterobacter hormaechei]RYH61310.1 hypothetical protein EVY07_08965 [Enterobacter hormaechei]
MSEKEQLEFILELCRQTRERNKPDLHKVWEAQQEAYRRAIGGNLYSYGTHPYRSGYSLYTY